MSYRPHKRKRATSLKGKCIEYVGDNLHKVFEAQVLDLKLREQVLEYLCETPNLVELPDGEPSRLPFALGCLPAACSFRISFCCQNLVDKLREEGLLRVVAGYGVC